MNKLDKRNFTYLNQLVNSGEKTIKIEYDIILEEDEMFPEGITITEDNITIDGNGHTIDAKKLTRIFKVKAKNVTLDNMTLKNGYSNKNGGAIYNARNSNLKIINLKFINNTARWGGAIRNYGTLKIFHSIIKKNKAKKGAGIYTAKKTKVTIYNSKIISNTARWGGGIHNYGRLRILKSKITKNCAKKAGAIYNTKKATMHIGNSSLISNNGRWGGCIYNYGFLNIMHSTINRNTSKKGAAIYNKGGKIHITYSKLRNNTVEFSYNKKRDMLLYGKGGAIFNYSGKLKMENTTIKNNIAEGCGGAIHNRKTAKMNLTDTTLKNNKASYGGAITNKGTMSINECELHENIAQEEGFVEYGGAINNTGLLMVEESTFLSNNSVECGGAIHNEKKGIISITDTLLADNTSFDGGAVSNEGKFTIKNCILTHNEAQEDGGAIDNFKYGIISISDSALTKNKADDGGSISNTGHLGISNSIIDNNIANHSGGAIANNSIFTLREMTTFSGEMTIENSNITSNRAENAGAITNSGFLNITESIVCNNHSDDGINIQNNGKIMMKNTKIQ